MFSSRPVTYGEVVDAVSSEIRTGATDAELKVRGGGLAYILQRLKLGDAQ
jgi:hypothetical protein